MPCRRLVVHLCGSGWRGGDRGIGGAKGNGSGIDGDGWVLTRNAGRPIFGSKEEPAMLNPTSPLPLKDPTLFRQANYIDGKWLVADSGRTIVVKNPATGEAIGEVPALGAAETRRAIEAAHRAQGAWRA